MHPGANSLSSVFSAKRIMKRNALDQLMKMGGRFVFLLIAIFFVWCESENQILEEDDDRPGSKGMCIWGYEDACEGKDVKYVQPVCTDEQGWRHFSSVEEKVHRFWEETDFGYVNKVKRLNYICEPQKQGDSSFKCNDDLTFCRGKDIVMDFTWRGRSIYERASSNPFEEDQFGGSCKLHPERFKHPDIFPHKLRSWAANDIDHFKALPFKPSEAKNCDIMVETPTIIMDLDFTGNMYHHFCDFFNLYITLHANSSLHGNHQIFYWSTLPFDRIGPFKNTWKAFTASEVDSIWFEYKDQKVCFKDVVFALLPRMPMGMYYSTPVIPGCSKSGLFKAFSEYVLKNLGIKQRRKKKVEPLRITLIYRSTKYRRIVNRNQLLQVLEAIPDVKITAVDFNWEVPFLEQLKISHNSDILIGIHGAGLVHTLFLPDWAALFELYNTEDQNCYKDLASLRGVTYVTWKHMDKLKDETEDPHPEYTYEKFRNYRFDAEEFGRLVNVAIKSVRENLEATNLT